VTRKEFGGTFGTSIVSITLVPWGGLRLSPFATVRIVWDIAPAPDDDEFGAMGGIIGRETELLAPNSTLSTTNPTCPDPGSNPGQQATNRLSYDTASVVSDLRI
jgi:hypothetical protein